MKCACCAAPLPPQAVVCAYCGSRQDVDLQRWVQAESIGPMQDLSCPDCRQSLEELRLGGDPPLVVGRCHTCLGLFLGHGVLEQLLSQAVRPSIDIDGPRLNSLVEQAAGSSPPLRYRHCPVCDDLMNRSLYGKRSGVIVDRCRDHGLWLDAGELRQLMEWAHAGGLLHHAARMEEEQREQERRRRQEEVERRAAEQELQNLEPGRGQNDWLDADLTTLLTRGLQRLLGS
ncbi:zf-TFIIB domain-containing protein [Synechococcus sp. CBW1107]|uniref:zf-TFIIB domain-containing protein n=1 Tax=Synechococcus sp. CBW1107 TaxID=2789857 RepID=UPI002AD38ABD|nr:zf-TFIIB domain-containing protein [Synechococcus sp. CBW1107]